MTEISLADVKQHTEPNTELFKKIYKQLKRQPGSLDMTNWEWSGSGIANEGFYNVFTEQYETRSCGTTRCVAGWAGHFTNPERPFIEFMEDLGEFWGIDPDEEDVTIATAARLLGLDYHDAYRLFLSTGDTDAVRVVKLFAKGKNQKALDILWGNR